MQVRNKPRHIIEQENQEAKKILRSRIKVTNRLRRYWKNEIQLAEELSNIHLIPFSTGQFKAYEFMTKELICDYKRIGSTKKELKGHNSSFEHSISSVILKKGDILE